MDQNVEQILVIYSAARTDEGDLLAVKQAISQFTRAGSSVRTSPLVFDIPHGAAPGATLGTELTQQLRASIGAVAFVDDLRPNVAYELGFFHGEGRTVLLVTRGTVDSVWTAISDLAGAALVSLQHQEMTAAIHAYLDRLYRDLGMVSPLPAPELPSADSNLLRNLQQPQFHNAFRDDGPFGHLLRVDSWEGITLQANYNLVSEASFRIAIRAASQGSDYSIYFRVLFTDRIGSRRRVWLGLTSSRRAIGMEVNERNMPAERATQHWRWLSASFRELLKRGLILGAGPVEHIDLIRFRAGVPGRKGSIEVGFLDIRGIS